MTDEILTIEEQFGRKALSYTHQFLQLCKTLDKTSHVLDLCCGYGRHALYLHEQGVRVSACDNELSAIESIRALDIADSELETDICDMSELPYSNATFDAVICYSALHHQCLAKLKNTLAEVKRVCKKGAIFSFDILSRNDDTCGIGTEIEPFTYIGGRTDEENVPHHYVDEAELRELLEGFKHIHIEEVTYKYVLNSQNMASTAFCVNAKV